MHSGKSPFIHAVNLADYEHIVVEGSHRQPVLVDFWADWCAPCITIAPLLERVVDEYQGRFLLAKVEVDEGDNMKLAGNYKLRGFPTCILFVDGAEVGRFSSHRPLHWIREFIDEHLPPPGLASIGEGTA